MFFNQKLLFSWLNNSWLKKKKSRKIRSRNPMKWEEKFFNPDEPLVISWKARKKSVLPFYALSGFRAFYKYKRSLGSSIFYLSIFLMLTEGCLIPRSSDTFDSPHHMASLRHHSNSVDIFRKSIFFLNDFFNKYFFFFSRFHVYTYKNKGSRLCGSRFYLWKSLPIL